MARTGEFRIALVGYDRREVDEFRDEMDAVLADLRGQIDELERRIAEIEDAKPITADQAFAHVARETQRILQAAQDAGTRMVQEAREQAEHDLAMARRERSQIVGDGYRKRDEMREQLAQLDQARIRLMRQLHEAGAEIDRVASGLESAPRTEDMSVQSSRQLVERARTGTDAQWSPRSSAALRVVADDTRPRQQRPRPVHPSTGDVLPQADPRGDLIADKRDHLAPLQVALAERLGDELGALRDRLREWLRRVTDEGDATRLPLEPDAMAGVAAAGATLLRQAFELGARTASAGTDLEPASSSDDAGAPLVAVLEERVGAPIGELLAEGRAAHDPPWVLVERIDGVISDASAAMVAQIAETELSRAYERGKLATWTRGGVARRRWITSPRGHRSDEQCRQNAAAGTTPAGQPFPSGDHTPPSFDGCSCTTALTKVESDP